MMLFKACPHCLRGDVIVEREDGHVVATCLQCGYTGELHSLYPPPRVSLSELLESARKREEVQAA